jgi:hypothetical protein
MVLSSSLYSFGTDRIENGFQQFLYYRVRIRFRDAYLLSRYLEADNFFWLHYSGLSAAMSQSYE